MVYNEFVEIVTHAIKKEYEAADFYRELQDLAPFAAQKQMLKDLENMEIGHARKLENLNWDDWQARTASGPVNLKISDYLVTAEPHPGMTYQEMLILAMKREEAAMKLYADMAVQAEGLAAAGIFRHLAAEESQHKNFFEDIYERDILKQN